MKLGLIIKITDEGEKESFSFNKDVAWAKYATDVRSSIKELDNFDGTEKTAYLVKFIGNRGYLICIVKASPSGSRPNDNTAAWIYFPNKISISGKQTESVLKTVEDAISARLGINEKKLEELFSEDYEENDVVFSAVSRITSIDNNKLAVRYYAGDTDYQLHEFLGEYIAQSEYNDYKAIFIIDKSKGIRLKNVESLTSNPKKTFKIVPPKDTDGFKPYIYGNPFNRNLELTENMSFEVTWKREGFDDIKKNYVAKENISAEIMINKNEYKRIIQRTWFKIVDEKSNEQLSDAIIKINDNNALGGKWVIAENEFQQGININVLKKDYEIYDEERKIEKLPIIINLKHKIFHYKFEVNAYANDKKLDNKAKIILETQKEILKSPIKGYSSYSYIREGEGFQNIITYDTPKLKLNHAIYSFIGGIVTVLIILAGLNLCCDYEFKRNDTNNSNSTQQDSISTNNPEETASESSEVAQKNDSINAIKYLANSSTWKKDSLQKYELTEGLFDDLNNLDMEKLVKDWNEKFSSSDRLKRIIEAAKKSIENDWDPTIGKKQNNNKYNENDDREINIEKYIKWISTNHRPQDLHSSEDYQKKHQKPKSNQKKASKNKGNDANRDQLTSQ